MTKLMLVLRNRKQSLVANFDAPTQVNELNLGLRWSAEWFHYLICDSHALSFDFMSIGTEIEMFESF